MKAESYEESKGRFIPSKPRYQGLSKPQEALRAAEEPGYTDIFNFKPLRSMLIIVGSRDPTLINVFYDRERRSHSVSRSRVDELFPDADIFRTTCGLTSFKLYDLKSESFQIIESWLQDGHPEPLSDNDHKAKRQLMWYLNLYVRLPRLKMATVQNRIIDVVTARKTCHRGWFDPMLVTKVYDATKPEDGLRRFFVDNFVYKSSRQAQNDPTARLYWAKHRSKCLSENLAKNNKQFVIDCYDLVASKRAVDPYTRGGCFYHDHLPGVKCYRAAEQSLKRKRGDSGEDC